MSDSLCGVPVPDPAVISAVPAVPAVPATCPFFFFPRNLLSTLIYFIPPFLVPTFHNAHQDA